MIEHNRYFDGGVQSLSFVRNGLRATVGVIQPGKYHFGTKAPERMTVVSGEFVVSIAGGEARSYAAGTYFEVPANSGFDIATTGPSAYLCEFLPLSE